MLKNVLFSLIPMFFSLFGCAQTKPDTPEDFIARIKSVVDSGNASRFMPELVLSKTEFREWWKDNCGNYFDYENPGPEMDKKLDKIVEETWPGFSRSIEQEAIEEGGFGDLWEKIELDSIKTDASPEAIGGALGRVPFVKEMVISAFCYAREQPEIRYEIRFMVAKIRDGKWKLFSRIVARKQN